MVELCVLLALQTHRDSTAALRLLWHGIDVLVAFAGGDVSLDHISNVTDVLVVHVLVTVVTLARRDQDSQQLEDGCVVLAGGQGLHSRGDEVELLLEVVEAYHSVNSVPVEHSVLDEGGSHQLAVDLLLVKDVEELLEQFYIDKVLEFKR